MVDLSLTSYFKMCSMADEILDEWEPRKGDLFFLKHNLYSQGDHLTLLKRGPLAFRKGFYFFGCGEAKFFNDIVKNKRHVTIFLPYQEYLQAKIIEKCDDIDTSRELLSEFARFIFKCGLDKKYKINELWLIFYYYKVHSKEWNGDDWVRMEER